MSLIVFDRAISGGAIAEQRDTVVALARVWANDGGRLNRWTDTSESLARAVERLQQLERAVRGWPST